MNSDSGPFIVPVLYSELFGTKPSRADLTQTIALLDWRSVVTFAAGISSISWQRGVEDIAHQQDLAANMLSGLDYGGRLLAMMTTEPSRRIFTREGLFGIVRIALEEQAVLEQLCPNAQDVFVTALLMANEIISDELLPISITHTAADLTKSEVRSQVMKLQNPHDLLARTEAFMRWSETADGQRSKNHLPVAADLCRFSGLTWREYAACAYVILSRYASLTTWEAVEREKIFFDPEFWMQDLQDRGPLTKWLQYNKIDLQVLAATWRQQESISLASAGLLMRAPLVEAEGALFAPSPSLLVNAMGEGAYFALFDAYGCETGDSTKKLQLSRFYGDFFEAYITDLLERSYAQRSGAKVYLDFDYVGGNSTDVILVENGDVLFVEIVAKRLNFVESVLKLDEAAILTDIAAGVVKKMCELHKHIENFRSGKLLPDLPRSAGQRIFPIIVSPNEWPRIRIIAETIPRLQESKGLLVSVEPIELVDAGEIESLENDLRNGLRLGDLLKRKNSSTLQNRMMTLNNYLYYVEPGTTKDAISPTRQRGGEVAQEIGTLAMSWFVQQ
jgi:hypothetical protein